MLDTVLFSRKEVIASSFPVNQFILEQELCNPTMYPIEKKIVPQMYPIRKLENPISKFRVGSPVSNIFNCDYRRGTSSS